MKSTIGKLAFLAVAAMMVIGATPARAQQEFGQAMAIIGQFARIAQQAQAQRQMRHQPQAGYGMRQQQGYGAYDAYAGYGAYDAYAGYGGNRPQDPYGYGPRRPQQQPAYGQGYGTYGQGRQASYEDRGGECWNEVRLRPDAYGRQVRKTVRVCE